MIRSFPIRPSGCFQQLRASGRAARNELKTLGYRRRAAMSNIAHLEAAALGAELTSDFPAIPNDHGKRQFSSGAT